MVNTPKNYAQLLTNTYSAIKGADPEAKVLIASAAGGDEQFLGFYREVFTQVPEAKGAFDIANVHCISNDSYDSFNVEPYKKMLAEFGLDKKPIWVTEAEAIISSDADINATQVFQSTKKALGMGAERIFYTMYDFSTPVGDGGQKKMPSGPVNITPELDGNNAEEAYQKITRQ